MAKKTVLFRLMWPQVLIGGLRTGRKLRVLNHATAAGSPLENLLLVRLPGDVYERLHPFFEPVQLGTGETVFRPNEAQKHAVFPGTCLIGYFYENENGQCSQVAMVGRDSLIGLAQLLKPPVAPGRYVTVLPGRAWKISARAFQLELLHNNGLMSDLLALTQREMERMAQLSFCHQHCTVQQQLVIWLLTCLDQIDSQEIRATQEAIAKILCVRRQGVSEAIGSLQSQGLGRVNTNSGHVDCVGQSRAWRSRPNNSPPLSTACPGNVATSV